MGDARLEDARSTTAPSIREPAQDDAMRRGSIGADVEVLIVGAGHTGLAVAHGLRTAGRSFVLVDARDRVGDAWRDRWDSLELFTPRDLDGLPGMPFPEGSAPFPGKDDLADYQENYARAMGIPVHTGLRVRSLRRVDGLFEAVTDAQAVRARAVVVATGAFHDPRIPDFARDLDASVLQLHSSAYGRPAQLPDGPVVVVGAANSGAEIAVEVARGRPTALAVSKLWPRAPRRFRDPRWWRVAGLRRRILGSRQVPRFLPWPIGTMVFTKVDLDAAVRRDGMRIAPRAIAAERSAIRFADGSEAEARTVIWATGFRIDHSWIEAPKTDGVIPVGQHGRGTIPGLWLVNERFLHWILRPAADAARDIASQLERA